MLIRKSTMMFAAVASIMMLVFGTEFAQAQEGLTASHKTVILVHGAFADGSSWRKVIPFLQKRGLDVVAVQNPLTSLADDIAATQQAMDRVAGPVILVGNSFAGPVITQLGVDPRVVSLVYVAAIAPDVGQSVDDIVAAMGPTSALTRIKRDAFGFLTLTVEGWRDDFAQDVPLAEIEVLASVQGPIASSALQDRVTVAAWKVKPSWYIVSDRDHALSPDLERSMAAHIGAHTITLPTSHMAMLSRPEDVAAVIAEAAALENDDIR